MKLFERFLREELKENGAGGGGAPANPTEPKAEPISQPAAATPATQAEGDQYDDFGYKITAAKPGDPPKETKQDPEPEPVATVPEEIKDPATGYSVEPKAVVVDPPAKVDPPPVDPNAPKELVIKAEGLPEPELGKVKEFAKKHSLSQEAAQGLADLALADHKTTATNQAQAAERFKREVAAEKVKWYNELKADPDFGGTNFQHNVHQVEKLVAEFMPHTKNILTKNGGVLPPYVMRDFAKVAERLYSTERMPQGGPPQPPKAEPGPKTEDDGLKAMYPGF